MILLLLACLQGLPCEAPPLDAQEGEPEDIITLYARGRGGAWLSGGFDYEAVQIDGVRKIDGRMLYTAGLDIGAEFYGHYVLFGGMERAWAGDVTSNSWSLGIGYTMDVPEFVRTVPPFRFTAYAGVMRATFDVDADRFSDFEDGWGLRTGAQFSYHLWGGVDFGLFMEGRYVRFQYEGTILEGNRFAGGGGFAAGATVELRF